MNDPILEVNNLRVSFRTYNGKVQAVRGIDFKLFEGETLAIVGESGSGKSVTTKAILGILPKNSIIEEGEILYKGEDLTKYEEKDFERLCQVHDPARKSELEYAGLPAAFLPLSIAAEREGLFEYQVYVAEDKGLVVGFIAFSDTELAWLYVDRSCARQGVGSELMRFALERVQDDAEIEVLDGNEPALALYAKFGFTTVRMVTGVMPGNESFPVTVHVLERQ